MKILDELQARFKQGTIVDQLIYATVAVFILVFVVNTMGYLFNSPGNPLVSWFILPASFDEFIYKPWTLISYGFFHVDFLHLLFNLIALHYIGNLFINYFTQKQFLQFFLLGTIFGGLLFLLSYNVFPAFANDVNNSVLLGASAGISAIFVGIATYMPNYQFNIRFIGYVKLWYLAAFWVLLDIIQIPVSNAGGHLAHLGGALFGFIYVSQASNKPLAIWDTIAALFTVKKKPLRTVYKSSKKETTSKSTKAEYQKKVDQILEKISASGYDALSKEEKEFLFKQGRK